MKIKHVGMGVVIIEDLLELDNKLLENYIQWLKKSEENTFEYRIEDGIEYAFNKTGFKFKAEDIKIAPQRFMDTKGINRVDKPDNLFVELIDSLESYSYTALVEYCKIFPDAATTAWWRPKGHIASYSSSQGIGPHCDDQVPFEWGKQTGNQNSMHNSVSINIYLNNCVSDISEINNFNFMGGELNFPHANYKWKPKVGSAAIYPSNYVGRHEVFPVATGERYAFLTVACYGTSFDQSEVVGEFNEEKIWMPDLIRDINA